MTDDFIGGLLMALCGLCIVGLLALCVVVAMSPSCEERGGHLVQDGYYFMPTQIGKSTYPMPYPNYRCEGSTK